nr:hypothetical protein [Tanacetum cinerariifolium]
MDMIICDLNKIPDLSQRPPQNCPKCRNPVDGHYCQGCALAQRIFKEDLFTYCIKNGILQDSFEPSNDNTNVVNALQEPFVVKQDLGENSSQSPPQINHHCCYGCGDSLEDIFCHQYTCELCGKGTHYGYNCPPKVPVVSNPEPCHNQNIDKLPQTVPSFDPTCYSEDGNSFTYDSTSNLVCGNDAYYGQDFSLQVPLNNDVQNIHEELAVYINTLSWDCPTICYDNDDDEDYVIGVTPSLSTKEPDNSLKDFAMDVVEDILPTREPRVHNALPTHPTLQLNLDFILSGESLFAYVVWIFLPLLSYLVAPQYLLTFGNEDTIFDPGISSYHISSFMPDVSHRSGIFIKFNVFNGSPMEILFSTYSPMDQ